MRFLLSFIIGVIVFSACQKEISPRIVNNFNDSMYIKKVISFDTTLPAGLDTGFTAEYFYDAQKRLVQVTETEYGPGSARYIYINTFKYQGADTLPYKQVQTSNQWPDSSITWFTFSNQFIIKDSVVNYTSGVAEPFQIRYFSQAGSSGYLLKTYYYDFFTGLPALTDSITYTRQLLNDNITGGMDKYWDVSTGALTGTITYQNNFDSRKNPFLKLHFWSLGYYENDILEFNYFGKNNVLEYSYTPNPSSFPGSYGSRDMNLGYTYREDGYPSVCRVLSGVVDFNKIEYVYVKL